MPNPSDRQVVCRSEQAQGSRGLPAFCVEVESGPLAARNMLARVAAQLAPIELEPEEAGTVDLILSEVMNNIVEHAYPDGGDQGPISLQCRHESDGLHFCIRDQGRMMPEGKLPLAVLPDLPAEIEDLPEGGFGWFLIGGLAKDVQYQRQGAENRLNLRIAVAYGQS